MTPELRAFALAFGQPETPAPELSPNGYPQVLVSMEKLIAAIRNAERAAYERAATEIERRHASSEVVGYQAAATVRALIDKPAD